MPIPLQWGPEFNAQLSNALANPAPPTVSPIALPDLASYRTGNSSALCLLDSRQIDSNGMLPAHLCKAAFGVWERLEGEMLTLSHKLNSAPEDTPEFLLLDSYVVAWITLVRINLGNLSLIDATSSPRLRSLAHGYIQKMRTVLEAGRKYDTPLEAALQGPFSPARLLRETMDSVQRGSSFL